MTDIKRTLRQKRGNLRDLKKMRDIKRTLRQKEEN